MVAHVVDGGRVVGDVKDVGHVPALRVLGLDKEPAKFWTVLELRVEIEDAEVGLAIVKRNLFGSREEWGATGQTKPALRLRHTGAAHARLPPRLNSTQPPTYSTHPLSPTWTARPIHYQTDN
jgi:hypothetical protein